MGGTESLQQGQQGYIRGRDLQASSGTHDTNSQ